ncbi:SDR family NAD(P)-dependent oxidoreductase [Sphingomonas crocodyli]|uniref:SDR family oxidoreductase n=1 Tax=Sphingomonas crocodyli TaxID=1979270 RepID=A0A437M9J8_9SPHN|nr:SDR family oxidoreductase [Sphingomonas crocodyli]RVT94362.1 SDR family oxidoreductase [Sphingomonas crocodyli]
MTIGTEIERLFALEGRVALVTGSAQGLGLVMARSLARCGAKVYLNGRDGDRLAAVRDVLAGEGLAIGIAPFDVLDADASLEAIDDIVATEGKIDILINNAGPRLRRAIDDIDADGFAMMMEAHVAAPFRLARAAAEAMKPGGWGRIVMLSSAAAVRGAAGDAAYTAAKGGVSAMTRALAAEYGAFGITCNALIPGRFMTESNAGSTRGAGGVLGRSGDPDEIAAAAIFLCSPGASFVTASALTVDGGVSNCY